MNLATLQIYRMAIHAGIDALHAVVDVVFGILERSVDKSTALKGDVK
jgi:hypothetical protein